jgi:hypothetical protein
VSLSNCAIEIKIIPKPMKETLKYMGNVLDVNPDH